MDHILIQGGIYHDFEGTSDSLVRSIGTLGLRTCPFADPEEALQALAASRECRLLTVNALRFTMTQHEKYAPLRAQWAFSLSEQGRRIIAGFVRGGGALLGLHTASICFDDWPEWRTILGARWRWGTSHHPPPANVVVEAIDPPASPIGRVTPFEVPDELYHALDVEPAARPLLRARIATQSAAQPVMWSHHFGRGRVIYDSLGHGTESLDVPAHQVILRRAVEWLLSPAQAVRHA